MKTHKISSSEYIGYLDFTSSSKISLPEDSSNRDNLANIIKNHVLVYDKYIVEEKISIDNFSNPRPA